MRSGHRFFPQLPTPCAACCAPSCWRAAVAVNRSTSRGVPDLFHGACVSKAKSVFFFLIRCTIASLDSGGVDRSFTLCQVGSGTLIKQQRKPRKRERAAVSQVLLFFSVDKEKKTIFIQILSLKKKDPGPMMSKPTGSTSGCLDILNVKSSKFRSPLPRCL